MYYMLNRLRPTSSNGLLRAHSETASFRAPLGEAAGWLRRAVFCGNIEGFAVDIFCRVAADNAGRAYDLTLIAQMR